MQQFKEGQFMQNAIESVIAILFDGQMIRFELPEFDWDLI